MISLYRTSSMWRPLSLMCNEKEYELGNIVFFNENGIITEIGFGYFDDDKERNFEGSVVRKLKVDFKMKDNFIVKSPKDYSYETRYDLYVYEGNVDIKFLGKEQKYFGDIYNHWQINDYEIWRYEKDLKEKLRVLNNKAENIIKLIAEKFGYNKTGIEENLFNERIKELKEINKQILEEVENIKNYKID